MFDRFVLAQFLMDYHSGQWSRGYRILSKLRVGGHWSSEFSAELREHPYYGHLVACYANRV